MRLYYHERIVLAEALAWAQSARGASESELSLLASAIHLTRLEKACNALLEESRAQKPAPKPEETQES